MKRYPIVNQRRNPSPSIQNSSRNRFGIGTLAIGLLAAMIGTASSADVSFISVLKGQRFDQISPTLVIMEDSEDSAGSLAFEAFAVGDASASIVSGNVQIPGGDTIPLGRENPTDSEFGYEYKTQTLMELDASKPNGTYTFQLTTKNDGVRTVSLNLLGDAYPNVPQITNYTHLQSVPNTAVPVTIQWTPMTGGTLNDFIMLSVTDSDTGQDVYESGMPGENGALNGTSTQDTLLANTLLPGHRYEAELLFIKLVYADGATYPGCQAVAGYYKVVSFPIQATATPGVALGARFEDAIPQNQTWDVARDSAIAFRFSHPMDPNHSVVSWIGTGVDSDAFEHEWVDGNRVLLCKYDFDLPANIDIQWLLDLGGFYDAAGFPLVNAAEGPAVGSFHTSSDPAESPPDANSLYLVKFQEFQQTGDSPVSSGGFGCLLEVELNAFNRVKQATVTVDANSRSGTLPNDDGWDPAMEIEAMYASKADLDLFFANGDFTFDLTTFADGAQSVTLSLGAADDYPAAPTVTNLPALQAIDVATDTTITWTALAGWSSTLAIDSGIIELEIENEQGNDVFYLENEDFTSGAQCTIPAGTLSPGRTYQVEVVFTKIKDLDDTSYAGVLSGGGFSSITSFTIQTSGDPVMPEILVEKSGEDLNLHFTAGQSNWCYIIESSRDMQRWVSLEQMQWGEGGASYYDNDARYLGFRFYRIRDCAKGEQIQWNRSIQGTVWTNDTQSTPVAGAVVGTSMDGQTVVTDGNGQFFLETDTPNGSGMYTITVTS